ncbi:MAG: MATE family efflux transporter [Clostridiales bacterium]|nr:MATE family efflux transporter [Clostridiales bacterium]
MKKEKSSMTEGPIFKPLVLFAIPLILTGILQQLYNTVDSVVIGKFSSSFALAGVGSSASLISLLTNLFVGFSTGASVVVSQYFGAKDKGGIEKSVHTSVALSLICGIIMTFLGLLIAKPALIWMKTPDDVLPYAVKYTSIYFLGIIPTLLYNFLAGILRAVGDSRRPLYYLIVSAGLNVVLNLFFVIVLKMDVEGVAIATIISQSVCCVLAGVRLMRVNENYRIVLRKIRIHTSYLNKILRIGIPTGLNSCLFAISNVIIQSTINEFGAAAIAGCAAAAAVESFVYISMNAIGIAATTYAGQNMGAKHYKRIGKGMYCSVIFVSVVGFILGITMWAFGTDLIGMFTNGTDSNMDDIIRFGLERMEVMALAYFLCGIMEVIRGTIQGMGESFVPMIISLIGVCVLRLVWIYTVLPFHKTIAMLFLSYPISWIISVIALYVYYRKILKNYSGAEVGGKD